MGGITLAWLLEFKAWRNAVYASGGHVRMRCPVVITHQQEAERGVGTDRAQYARTRARRQNLDRPRKLTSHQMKKDLTRRRKGARPRAEFLHQRGEYFPVDCITRSMPLEGR